MSKSSSSQLRIEECDLMPSSLAMRLTRRGGCVAMKALSDPRVWIGASSPFEVDVAPMSELSSPIMGTNWVSLF